MPFMTLPLESFSGSAPDLSLSFPRAGHIPYVGNWDISVELTGSRQRTTQDRDQHMATDAADGMRGPPTAQCSVLTPTMSGATGGEAQAGGVFGTAPAAGGGCQPHAAPSPPPPGRPSSWTDPESRVFQLYWQSGPSQGCQVHIGSYRPIDKFHATNKGVATKF